MDQMEEIAKQQHLKYVWVLQETKKLTTDENLIKQIESFGEYYFSCRRLHLNIKVSSSGGGIALTWVLDHGTVEICFYGDFKWKQSLYLSEMQKNDTENCGNIIYIFNGSTQTHAHREETYGTFTLEPIIEEYVTIPDMFGDLYSPMLPANRYGQPYDLIKLWHTNYYDGVISGYCLYKRRLHYYTLRDESYCERNRIYSVHRISIFDGIKATLSHLRWKYMQVIPLEWKWYLFKHKHFTATRKFDPVKSQKSADKYGKWLNKQPIVGYFIN